MNHIKINNKMFMHRYIVLCMLMFFDTFITIGAFMKYPGYFREYNLIYSLIPIIPFYIQLILLHVLSATLYYYMVKKKKLENSKVEFYSSNILVIFYSFVIMNNLIQIYMVL